MAEKFTIPPPKGFMTPTPTPGSHDKKHHKAPLNVHHALTSTMLEKLMAMKNVKHIVHHHYHHGKAKNA